VAQFLQKLLSNFNQINMRKIIPLLLLMGGAIIMMTSCLKNETVYYDELDVTLTNYEVGFDFSSYTSFAMPDSTILKTNYLTEAEIESFYAPGGTSENTLALLKSKFQERGYTFTESVDNADFMAVPTVLMIQQSGAVYYPPGWWWGYPGWGWGGWGGWWGYPGYGWNPGYVQYYSYKVGTIVLEMVDGKSFRDVNDWGESRGQGEQAYTSDEVPDLTIRWMASIDGYISSNAEYNTDRAQRGMDEAFEQSPYLKK
jgi:hypothetical protein